MITEFNAVVVPLEYYWKNTTIGFIFKNKRKPEETLERIASKIHVDVSTLESTNYGSKGPNVDYEAIKKGFETLNKNYKNFNLKIGIPKIGAGLAGGDWDVISSIINDATPDLNITLYEFIPVNKESV